MLNIDWIDLEKVWKSNFCRVMCSEMEKNRIILSDNITTI